MHFLLFLALYQIFCILILLLRATQYERPLASDPSEKDLLGNVALACPAKQITMQERIVRFDTSAKPIRVDNQCSACISPYIDDFIGPLEDTNKNIKGFAGARMDNPKMVTLRWQWADDSGKRHTFEIPNSYFVPSCELRLLSPQHWAQTRNSVNRETTRCITSSVNVYLRWTNREENCELTLPLNKQGSNVGTLYSHPGYNKYDLFCQAAAITIADDKDPIALPAHLISDDEDKEERNTEPQIGPPPITIPKIGQWKQRETTEQTPEETPRELHLSLEPKGMATKNLRAVIEDDDTSVIMDKEDRQKSTREAELLMAHHRFQHISFSKLQEMARQGILPKKLAYCKIPSCSACLYRKATKRAWRSKLGKKLQKRKP